MNYEELQIQNDTLHIHEMNLSDIDGLKGFYLSGNIAIEKEMTSTEKACVLAEELGHHYTTVGNILDMNVPANRRQEQRARAWAYNKMVGLIGIVKAYEHGCNSLHETADYLNVTEEFLNETLKYYRSKYGIHTTIDNYIVFFEPTLGICKLIESPK